MAEKTCRFTLTKPANPEKSQLLDGISLIRYVGVSSVPTRCGEPAVGEITIGRVAYSLCQAHLDYVRANMMPLLVSDPEAVRACQAAKKTPRPRKPRLCPHCGKPIP